MIERSIELLILTAAFAVATACKDRRDKRELVNDDETARPAPSTRPDQAAPPVQQDAVSWPIVEVSASEVRVDEQRTDTTRHILELGRLQKLDGMFAILKSRRESFKEANPGKPFPGVCGIRVDGEVPQLVFKSVFQTAAFAGYPRLSVQRVGFPGIYDLAAQVPGPPDPSAEPKSPKKILDVHIEATAIQLRWRLGSVVTSERSLSRDEKELSRVACEEWSAQGSHRDAADPIRDEVIVHTENDALFKDVPAYLAALGACKREYSGGAEPKPVFDITFSIR